MGDSNYVNGVIPSIGKRIAEYTFQDKFHDFIHNKKEHTFEVYIKGEVGEHVITHFKKHWPGFKVFKISTQES